MQTRTLRFFLTCINNSLIIANYSK